MRKVEHTDRKKRMCCGCQACQDICPKQAIHMDMDSEGFWYPVKEEKKCVGCGACERVCPIRSRDKGKKHRSYIGVQAKNDEVRFSSSSGGIFFLLADYVLNLHGVVFGAGFDEKMVLIHRSVWDADGLRSIQKTKYIQSDMEGIYREVTEYLRQGKWVLFCGTPCQAEAMRLFIQGNSSRLILVDLICYGVASPNFWKDYVNYLEHRNRGRLVSFSFRDKRNRDSGRCRSYVIGGKETAEALEEDPYCRLYFRNYLIRPSCYVCRFCTVERNSDFTIGDFWGIERVRQEWDDGMGTSLVMIHTRKAEEVWSAVRGYARWFSCEEKDILQPRLFEPTRPAKYRGLFMRAYRLLPFWLLMWGIERK